MDTNENPHKKHRLLFWSLLLTGIIGTGIMLWLINFSSVSLRISPETTFVTEPKTSDGKWIDYFKAVENIVYSPELATENNGYRLLMQKIGPNCGERKDLEYAEYTYEKLGIDKYNKPTLTYTSGELTSVLLGGYLTTEFLDEEQRKVAKKRIQSGIWTEKEKEIVESWVRQTGPALDVLGEAVRKPTYCVPFFREKGRDEAQELISLLLPEMQLHRDFARSLHTRVLYRLGNSDIDGAIDDTITILRIGRWTGHGFLVHSLVGNAIESIAMAMPIRNSAENNPTDEQIKRLMYEIRNAPPRFEAMDAIKLERYFGLSIVQDLAKNGGKGASNMLFNSGRVSSSPSDLVVSLIPIDWNILAKKLNKRYDEIEAGTIDPSAFTKWLAHWTGYAGFVLSRNYRSEKTADICMGLISPAIDALGKSFERNDCALQLKLLTLAMLRYEAANAALPPAFSVDANGKPLHSWRVLILPYLDDPAAQDVYDKIRLDESWDSKHNKAFHGTELPIFTCPSFSSFSRSSVGAGASAGETTYTVILGTETPFDESGIGKSLTAGLDPATKTFGLHTILIAERPDSVCWMNPSEEIKIEDAEIGVGRAKKIGSFHSGGANFGFANGAVLFLSETIEADIFRSHLDGTAETNP